MPAPYRLALATVLTVAVVVLCILADLDAAVAVAFLGGLVVPSPLPNVDDQVEP